MLADYRILKSLSRRASVPAKQTPISKTDTHTEQRQKWTSTSGSQNVLGSCAWAGAGSTPYAVVGGPDGRPRPHVTALRFQCSTFNPARQESASLSHVAGHGLLAPKSVVHRLAALPLPDRRDGWWRSVVRSRKSSGQPVERPLRSGPKRTAIALISIHKERATARTGSFQRAR